MVQTVGIFGVGLIGGSFALALRRAGYAGKILGVSSPETIQRALQRGVIDEGVDAETAARRSNLLYLAQPIDAILNILPLLDEWVMSDALVTDAGSTKQRIVEVAAASLKRCQFLGGHPLAGKESRGIDAADGTLFCGRTYVLTPRDSAELDTPAAREFMEWIRSIGARPVTLDATQHDRTVAFTSHLPQLMAIALGKILGHHEVDGSCVFGPALLDSTRLALSSFEIWKDILSTNEHYVQEALGEYIAVLEELRQRVGSSEMLDYFAKAEQLARRLRT
jgi:prephenate dehydrogenase